MDDNLLGDCNQRRPTEVASMATENKNILHCCEKFFLTTFILVDVTMGVLFNLVYRLHIGEEHNKNKRLLLWCKFVSINYIWLYSILLFLLVMRLIKHKIRPNYHKNITNVALFFLHLFAIARFIVIIVITIIMTLLDRRSMEKLRILVLVWLCVNYLSIMVFCKYFTVDFVKNILKCCNKKNKKPDMENGCSRKSIKKLTKGDNKESSVVYT